MLRVLTSRATRAAVTVALTTAALTTAALVVPVALAAPARAAGVPTVTAAAPRSGTINGGTVVTVTGTDLTGATAVRFGAAPAATFRVVSPTRITATSPAGNPGVVDIRVTTAAGTSAAVTADRFTYVGGYRLTATTGVGTGPAGVAVDPTTNTAYVADSGDDTVSVVDLATNRVVDEVYVPPAGGGSGKAATAVEPGLGPVAVDIAHHLVYVLDTAGGRVVVLDATTRTVVRALAFDSPVAVTVDQTSHLAYVVSAADSSLIAIDSAGNTESGFAGSSGGATAIAVDPTTRTGYVTNASDGDLAVVDLTDLSVTAFVPVGRDPSGVTVDPTDHAAYVANSSDDTVSVVQGGRVTATFPVAGADRLEFDVAARTLYVVSDTGTVRVVDPARRAVTATVTVPDEVTGLAFDPMRHALVVAAASNDTVSVVQAGNPPLVRSVSPSTGSVAGGRTVTITGTGFGAARGVRFGSIPAPSFTVVSGTVVTAVVPAGVPGTVDVRVVGRTDTSPATAAARWTWTGSYRATATTQVRATPVAVAVDPAARLAYVVNSNNDSVSVLDTRTDALVRTLGTGFTPAGVAVDPTTHLAVATSPSQGVSIYQGTTPTTFDPVDVGAGPTAAAVDPTTHRFYLLTPGSNEVAVFDAAGQTVTARIRVGSNPVAIAVDPTRHRVYVVNAGSKDMSVIDGTTGTVVRTKEFGVEPTGVAVDPTTDTVFASFGSRDLIGLTNGTTGFDERVVTVGDNPTGITVDPTTHAVYVTNTAGNSVSVVDGTTGTVVGTVPVGPQPSAVGVDTVGHRAVVADTGTDTVSVVTAADVPTVTGVSPDEGSFIGGRRVTITGTDLTGATAVDFGEFPATSFTVVSATQIRAVSPVGNLDEQVHVGVTTPFGTSAPTAADTFTFVRATPTLATTPSAGVGAGGTLSSTVRVLGGSDPTGTVTFELYGPSAPTCTGDPFQRLFAGMSGRTVRSPAVTVTVAGTYHWVVTYNGDHDNQAVTTGCRDATVVTAGALDRITLTPATSTVTVGAGRTYVVAAFDAYGNRRGTVTANSVLTIAGGGSCTGATCSSTVPGDHAVTATSGGKTATAVLRVVAAAGVARAG